MSSSIPPSLSTTKSGVSLPVNVFVSAISIVEVLGYQSLNSEERIYLERFFETANVLTLSNSVIAQAVTLRQLRRMTLGDALVAATALTHQETLITRNVKDFDWIDGLKVVNPFEPSQLNAFEEDDSES